MAGLAIHQSPDESRLANPRQAVNPKRLPCLDGQAQLPKLILDVKFANGLEVAARATRQPATAAA
jgi:hypothetical protein